MAGVWFPGGDAECIIANLVQETKTSVTLVNVEESNYLEGFSKKSSDTWSHVSYQGEHVYSWIKLKFC